jgi:hypothetical protein
MAVETGESEGGASAMESGAAAMMHEGAGPGVVPEVEAEEGSGAKVAATPDRPGAQV